MATMLRIFSLFMLLLCGQTLFATHNLAGDITYRHVGGFTYEFTITIFSDGNSPAINRREIEISYGDNTRVDSISIVSQTNIGTTANPIIKRIWRTTHTYSGGAFTYTVRVEDPNRNANVVNMVNSVNTPFTIQTKLVISPFAGEENNSVLLRNDPLDDACTGAVYVYNAGAFDPDGTDSIAYRIARSLGANGNVAENYVFPAASNSISVNPLTGDLIWDSPTEIGLHNVGIEIIEYRDGRRIGSVLRDIQINVVPGCTNNPPAILADQLVCIEAGNFLRTVITSTDIDGDDVSLSATGELFEPPILSRVTFNSGVASDTTNASFEWNTLCEDVRIRPYVLSIKAEDNAVEKRNQPTNLVNFRTVNIRVIAPSPENFSATSFGNSINLNWTNSSCDNGIGYHIYRRRDSSGFQPSICTPGVPDGIGFTRITTINSVSTLNYSDNDDLIPGQKYCYLITSFFTDGDESYASDEVCAEIEKVVPVLTNVTIDSTNSVTGIVDLEWSPPAPFDTVAFPPPYRYLISEAENGDDFVLIDSTNSIIDTSYTVLNRNTTENDFAYRVTLYSLGGGNRQIVGRSPKARSIYLTINSTDNLLQLNWSVDVPWNNTSYTIFRKLPISPTYDSIGTTTELFYNDSNLVNGEEYCYFIRSTGNYNLTSVKTPLINLSQINCKEPIDNVSPCPIEFTLTGDCILGNLSLNWNPTDPDCPQDVAFYRIYRSSTLTDNLIVYDSVLNPNATEYLQNGDSIAGCYSVSALDSAGNESTLTDKQCIEYCPYYELPNVFTPNGDGINDFFTPIRLNNIVDFRYVDSIDLVIYNRWGTEVFKTDQPAINWTGERIPEETTRGGFKAINQEANEAADGVFFYVCKVFEASIEPKAPRILKGTVTILDAQLEKKN